MLSLLPLMLLLLLLSSLASAMILLIRSYRRKCHPRRCLRAATSSTPCPSIRTDCRKNTRTWYCRTSASLWWVSACWSSNAIWAFETHWCQGRKGTGSAARSRSWPIWNCSIARGTDDDCDPKKPPHCQFNMTFLRQRNYVTLSYLVALGLHL